MEAKASAKYVRGSAQKARLVVDLVRGKTVNQALSILPFTNKRAADHVEKIVRSAIANATELATRDNIAVDPDDLWIKTAYVDQGPMKGRFRMRPAPQGRAFRERRHYCHITLVVSTEDNPQQAKERLNKERAARSVERRRLMKAASPQTTISNAKTSVAATPTASTTAVDDANDVTTVEAQTPAVTHVETPTTSVVEQTRAAVTLDAPNDATSESRTTKTNE